MIEGNSDFISTPRPPSRWVSLLTRFYATFPDLKRSQCRFALWNLTRNMMVASLSGTRYSPSELEKGFPGQRERFCRCRENREEGSCDRRLLKNAARLTFPKGTVTGQDNMTFRCVQVVDKTGRACRILDPPGTIKRQPLHGPGRKS